MRVDARRFREDLPSKILNKPTLHFGNALFLNAWFELDLERTRPERITRSVCFSYADDYELSWDQKEDLWYHIQRMDSEFVVWWKKKQPPPPKGPKKGTGRG